MVGALIVTNIPLEHGSSLDEVEVMIIFGLTLNLLPHIETVETDVLPTRAVQKMDLIDARSVCCGQTLHKILPTSVYQQRLFRQWRFRHLPVDTRILLPFGLIIGSRYGVDELAEVRIAEVCDAVP